MMSIEDFIRLKYPPPSKDDPDYHFYQSWDYEQYLIKRYKHNMDGLKALERAAYNQYRLGCMLNDSNEDDPTQALVGMPLVRAKGILEGFLMQAVPKGAVGVLLWEEIEKAKWSNEEDRVRLFCLFPGRSGAFHALMRSFDPDDLEILDRTFEDEQSILAMQPTDRVAYVHQLRDRAVAMPGLGNIYVLKTWSGDYAGTYYTIECVPAIPGKSVTWKRKPKAEKKRVTIRHQQLEDAVLLT